MKKIITISSMLCLATSVFAQISPDSVYQIPDLVIDKPDEVLQTGAETPIDELDQQRLQGTTAQTIGDASKFFSGVLVKDYGGVGGLKTVSVRGLGAEHTTVVWDGVKITSEQSGQVDLSKYPVLGLEGVHLNKILTVDKAATATSYASAALLSLNSIQKLDTGKFSLQGSGQTGSYGFYKGELSLMGQPSQKTFVGIHGRWLSAEGDYDYNYQNGSKELNGTRINSEVSAVSMQGDVSSDISKVFTLKGKVFYSKNNTNLPGAVVFYNPESSQSQETESLFGQLILNYHKNKWEVNFRTKAGHQYMNYVDPDFLNSTGGINDQYKQQEYFNSLAASYQFVPSTFIYIASDLQTNMLSSNVQEMPSPIRMTSLNVVGIKGRLGRLSWNGNVLFVHYEENEQEGFLREETPGITPTLGLNYELLPQLNVRASYKEAYRIPTFNELYYVRVGNQNLKAERAHLWNGGLVYGIQRKGTLAKFVLSADAFYQEVENKIIAIPTQNLFIWSMQNIGEVSSHGIDWSLTMATHKTAVGTFSFTGNYTYQRALDVSDEQASNYKDQIPYVPIESGSTLLRWQFGSFSLGYTAVYSGFRYAQSENINENLVEAWSQHDVVLRWKKTLSKHTLTLRAEVLNLTDQNYDVIRYYPMPGRQWRGGVTVEL